MERKIVRQFQSDDEAEWHTLWQDYNVFYKRTVEGRVTRRLWQNLIESTNEPYGWAAELEGKLVGFAHYFFVPSTSDWAPRCYMQDLFVSDEVRGNNLGKALIDAVNSSALEKGAAQTYWLTDKNNGPARTLYERVANETNFIKYRI